MKPFNLEEAKAGKPVCTRDGKEVKILDFDFYTPDYHDYTKPNHFMVVKIKKRTDDEIIELYKLDGLKNQDGTESWDDLMMKTEKHEGWANILVGSSVTSNLNRYFCGIFSTKEEAQKYNTDNIVDCVKIEWEE
ncbi:MAG: hypothetical protein II037_10115 [Bacteroidales bacterium]|nr:hypothetical protein [Bacteroidales bacterium]